MRERREKEAGLAEQRPPTVNIEPTKEWRADVGNSFEFRCVGQGDPAPSLSWSREDGQPLGPNVQDLGDGTLTLSKCEFSDQGAYICTGRNPNGVATDRAYVRLGKTLLVRIIPEQAELRIPEGAPLRLECEVSGSGEPDGKWIRDRPPERGDNPDNYSPETIDGLVVTHPAVTTYNGGDYTCRGTNGQMSKDRTITVVVIPAAQRPVRILGSSEQAYEAGTRVTLTCTAPGPLQEEVSWQRVGADGEAGSEDLPDGAEETSPGVLVFTSFSATDAGSYECQAYDQQGGQPVSTARMQLSLLPASDNQVSLYLPLPQSSRRESLSQVVVEGPNIRVLQEGDTLNLQCDAPGFLHFPSQDHNSPISSSQH